MFKEKVISAIMRYKQGNLNEIEFQKTLESIVTLIEEDQLHPLKELLIDVESELEFINFMVNSNLKHEKYLEQITRIENIIYTIE